ncbi:HAD family phosphatase [Leptolyngbya sp. FACHB-16]|nr:HAD family phosphatase [Leptolyngbya sp. FACHB-8]MBD2156610.1 HAD family phosphatase [Leptolyngbya sp. FACHB-16]
MDGTLTHRSKYTSTLLHTLEELAKANLPVLIVTGRSGGWVEAVAHYMPVVGAIAENGGLFFHQPDTPPDLLVPITHLNDHRLRLAEMFGLLQERFPHLQEASDNRFRLTDWTFDVHGLSDEDLSWMSDRCQSEGWGFTYSTVQCHIKLPQQEKAAALRCVLDTHFPHLMPEHVVTVGDSPNDESLFNGEFFPYSVGVANVGHYGDRLTHYPRFITPHAEVEGFAELAEYLLKSRKNFMEGEVGDRSAAVAKP